MNNHFALLKTLSWLLIGFTLSVALSVAYYGSFTFTGFLVLLAIVVNCGYYVHEKAWNRIEKKRRKPTHA